VADDGDVAAGRQAIVLLAEEPSTIRPDAEQREVLAGGIHRCDGPGIRAGAERELGLAGGGDVREGRRAIAKIRECRVRHRGPAWKEPLRLPPRDEHTIDAIRVDNVRRFAEEEPVGDAEHGAIRA